MLPPMHHDDTLDGESNKPKIFLHHNVNVGCGGIVDYLACTHSDKYKTNRWHLALLFNMVDVAGTAPFMILICNNLNLYDGRFAVGVECFLMSSMNITYMTYSRGAFKNLIWCEKALLWNQKAAGKKVRQICATCSDHLCNDHSTQSVNCNMSDRALDIMCSVLFIFFINM